MNGYNAIVPCSKCRNVVGRCDRSFRHPTLVHILSSEHERFDRHTSATMNELADYVKDVALHGSHAQLADAQKSSGIKFDMDGALWDPLVRRTIAPPMGNVPDWMHTWCSSGGIAQYELNCLILELTKYDLTLKVIDDWAETVRMPKGFARLPRGFFQQRVSMAEATNMKAFASEILSVVTLLGFLSTSWLCRSELQLYKPTSIALHSCA